MQQDQDNIHVQIYALIDPVTEQTRYIGQTRYRLAVRLKQHLGDSRRAPLKAEWIESLAKQGHLPRIKLLATVPAEDADATEYATIHEYAQKGCDLVNTREHKRPGAANKPKPKKDRSSWKTFFVTVALRDTLASLAEREERSQSKMGEILLKEAMRARGEHIPDATDENDQQHD